MAETLAPSSTTDLIHDLFWAGLSAVLLTLSFPSPDLGFLAWVALVPLLIRARTIRPGRGFRLGWFAGVLHFGGLVYWVSVTVHQYGGIPLAAGVAALVLLSLYLGLYLALFSWGVGRWTLPWPLMMLLAPSLWVTLEYARTFLVTGFPWGLLGYSQHQLTPLIQMADITGVYGVSFLVVMGNTALAAVISSRKERFKEALIPLGVFLGVAGAVLGYGSKELKTIKEAQAKAPSLAVGVLQGNIDQSKKWDDAFRGDTLTIYETLAKEALAQKPDLMVLPETALPFYYLRDKRETLRVNQMMAQGDADWIVGAPAAEPEGLGWRFYNRAYAVSSKGALMGAYDKVHLVPFGEYVPLADLLFFIEKLVVAAGNFSAGEKGSIIQGQRGDKIWRAGGQICFESIFPELSVASVRSGANLLVNLTNDAWFGRTGAPFQHLQMARFRAIETRRSLIRSANTGISGFVLPTGELVGATALYETAWRVAKVPMLDRKSLYVRFGDLFAWICMGMTLLLGLRGEVLRRRFQREKRVSL